MFASISLAAPNSTVTSQFTADEACTVGIGAEYPVRVNGTLTTARPIVLSAGQKIEADVVAGLGNSSKFIPWTYNGNDCYFAVASSAGTNKSSLKARYRNKIWLDIPGGQILFSRNNGSSESNLNLNAGATSVEPVPLAAILAPSTNSVLFYKEDGNLSYRVNLSVTPLGFVAKRNTAIWLGGGDAWEGFTLGGDGYIYKNNNATVSRSATAFPGAKCIFTDGQNLYIGGTNLLVQLTDWNATPKVYTITETINAGAAAGGAVMAVTASGKILNILNTTVQTVYQSGSIGEPAAFKNSIVFPITEEYKLKVYDSNGAFAYDMSMGDELPLAIGSSDTRMTVTCADSKKVYIYTALGANATNTSYSSVNKITYATPLGSVVYCSHYLNPITLTTPPNTPVNGVNFPYWTAPVDVDTGTGEYPVTTDADDLPAAVAPNAQLLINGLPNTLITSDKRVQVIMRSQLGRRSTAITLGNFAYDFKVKAGPSEAITTSISVPPRFMSSQVVFDLVAPALVVDAPVAVSHGTLAVNGARYNGTTPIKAGDRLVITMNIPATVTQYYGMLSLADSQFALVINTATNRDVNTQRYQEYSSSEVISTITVDEAGTYSFPNYTNAKVTRNGVDLQFPTTLAAKDSLTIRHTRMSSWWFDARTTVLMGPNSNYIVSGVTKVDDAPQNVDFGYVADGLPGFESPAPDEITIVGLSDGYSVQIYSDYLRFIVNGGEPSVKPTVKNGDKVKALYTVRNLFDDTYANVTLYDGRVYGFGVVHINPAKGVNYVPNLIKNSPASRWFQIPMGEKDLEAAEAEHAETTQYSSEAPTIELVSASTLPGVAPISMWEQGVLQSPTQSSVGAWEQGVAQMLTPANIAFSFGIETQAGSDASTSLFMSGSADKRTNLSKAVTEIPMTVMDFNSQLQFESRAQFEAVDISENFQTSFGHFTIFQEFDGYWLPLSDVVPEGVTPFYLLQERSDVLRYTVGWTSEAGYTFTMFAPGFNFQTTKNFSTFEPTWMYQNQENHFALESPKLIYAYETWDHIEFVPLDPYFVGLNKTLKNANIPVNDPSRTPLLAMNVPLRVQTGVASAEGSQGWYAAELAVSNTLPVGGYTNEAQAATAGRNVAGNLVVQTYKQPEGTFSYYVKRETNLVCTVKETGVIAKGWLIGGG